MYPVDAKCDIAGSALFKGKPVVMFAAHYIPGANNFQALSHAYTSPHDFVKHAFIQGEGVTKVESVVGCQPPSFCRRMGAIGRLGYSSKKQIWHAYACG
ncbi:hypothetical protein [Pseudomonas sp. TWI628]|uniref:hypothetical protein n=1 Tax=Pseudomonas sp. TWI628 TaxID=3136788 RepID=UPI00320A831D